MTPARLIKGGLKTLKSAAVSNCVYADTCHLLVPLAVVSGCALLACWDTPATLVLRDTEDTFDGTSELMCVSRSVGSGISCSH